MAGFLALVALARAIGYCLGAAIVNLSQMDFPNCDTGRPCTDL